MRIFLLLFSLTLSIQAYAFFVQCDYQQIPCDEEGNHFYCVYYGWAQGEFCSADDQTKGSGPGEAPARPSIVAIHPKSGHWSEKSPLALQ